MKLIQFAIRKFAISPKLLHTLSATNSFPIFPGCLQGKKMAICTDNITDVTLKDMVAESEDFSNFVGAFVCQSTIIPSDSKGFRTALALQSNSLADRFLGTCFVLCMLLQVNALGHRTRQTIKPNHRKWDFLVPENWMCTWTTCSVRFCGKLAVCYGILAPKTWERKLSHTSLSSFSCV